jgi:phosphohistidine swiveling domain-containing protein
VTGPTTGVAPDPADSWDPLHDHSAPTLHWSTDNLGEAAPGVLTPLGWSLWRDIGERASREALHRLGALDGRERVAPEDPDQRILRIFFGRVAMQVEFLSTLGDRMPGTTGQDVVRGIFGRVPEDIEFRPTRRRYPAVAVRLPLISVTVPGRVRRLAGETDVWWRRSSQEVSSADLATATTTLRDAAARFYETLALHTTCLMGVVQPMFDALSTVVERAGVGEVAILSGTGGAEMAVVADIWRAARQEIPVAQVISTHGFHGPAEGELSSRVWREDDTAVRRLLADYAARPDSDSPLAQEKRRRAQASEMRQEVLAALPLAQRAPAAGLLRLAAARIPLRGVGKRSFLQGLDVARAAARRIGQHLAADGRLIDAEDVFYLTHDELTGVLAADLPTLVACRRARREFYRSLRIPAHWTGQPLPVQPPPTGTTVDDPADPAEVVTGIGVSAGVVEGVVRVVTEPDFTDVEAGEVLVAPTTDPSWSSIMFVSSALVVDIGSALSHAAVVARELGLPCVVNTREGTRVLRTGDRVRVDGATGTVQILRRTGSPSSASAAT